MQGAVSRRWLRAGDGTRLAWYEGGRADGPPLVFLSGLGGGFGIFEPFVERFRDRCRLIGWDYRGLYHSRAERPPACVAVGTHVRDLLALLEHARVESPVLVGWSMGVQVGLELHRSHPDLARALVCVHGAAGRPLDSAFDSPLSPLLAPPALALLARAGVRFSEVGPRLATAPGVARAFTWLCRGLGMMSRDVDVEAFRAVAEEWTRLDFAVYAETFRRLGEHDASDLLPKIATPTLLVAGERDPFTPAHIAHRMADFMPDAEVALVPGATHFGLLEAPREILDAVARFLAARLGLAL